MIFLFIYLKQNSNITDCKYIISQKECENGHYFEILFKKSPCPHTVYKAVKRCSRQPLPIAKTGIRLDRRLESRALSTKGFMDILLINAFSTAVSGQKRALVCDRDGRFSKLLSPPLTRVGTLCVLTERPDIYERVSRTYLSAVGNSPLLISQRDAYGFTATLCAEKSENACGLIFGEGGFLPVGDTVICKGKEYDLALMAALYSCFDINQARLCIPKYLQNRHIKAGCHEFKQMLDSMNGLTL